MRLPLRLSSSEMCTAVARQVRKPVKEAIDRMEAILSEPTQEGQDSKTATEAVAEVVPSSKFHQNVSLETSAPKKSAPSAVCATVQELEEEVQAERQVSAALRFQIEYQRNQLESLTANQKQQQELDRLFTPPSSAIPQQIGDLFNSCRFMCWKHCYLDNSTLEVESFCYMDVRHCILIRYLLDVLGYLLWR